MQTGESMKKRKFPYQYALILVVVVVLIIVAVHAAAKDAEKQDTQAGIDYLEAMEQKVPDAVEEEIRAIQQQRREAEREELLRKLSSGELDVWSMFQDYVILGDSRAVGFSVYGFLDEENVLAVNAETIFSIDDHYDEIRAVNPSYIFLCYGVNDIIYWNNAEEYAEGFAKRLTELQNEFPSATIIVSSILSTTDDALERSERFSEVPEYSAAVEQYCDAHGILFANCDEICAEHIDMWNSDGIHMQRDFYPYWASVLIVTMLEGENREDEVNQP